MASVLLFVFFLLSHFLLLQSAEGEMKYTQKCPRFPCGNLPMIGFPFANASHPECGVFTVECHDFESTIQLGDNGGPYPVFNISSNSTIRIFDEELAERFTSQPCESLTNLSFPGTSFFSFEILAIPTLFFKCNRTLNVHPPSYFKTIPCDQSDIFYNLSYHSDSNAFSGCSIILLPTNYSLDPDNLPPDFVEPYSSLTLEYDLEVDVSPECYECFNRGGQCKAGNNMEFYCDGVKKDGLPYDEKCPPFRCGNLGSIGFPFANKSNPECGLFTLDCGEMKSTIQLKHGGRSYQVTHISQYNTLRIIDEEVLERWKSRFCKSLTNWTFPTSSFSSFEIIPNQTFFKCNSALNDSFHPDFKNQSCGDFDMYYNSSNEGLPDAFPGCSIIQLPKNLGQDPVRPPKVDDPFSLVTPYIDLVVNVRDECYECYEKGGQCKRSPNSEFYCDGAESAEKGLTEKQKILLGTLLVGVGVGVVLLAICCFRRKLLFDNIIYFGKRKSLTHQTIQAFLREHGHLAIKQYNYSNIKKITNSFKDKLGEGGYGSVYKGKLQDGCLVAVKVLKESKGNGEEFINEVATISRTSHVNIVSLMGFCFEYSKRALIYEFMPNGFLEKFIYKTNPSKDVHHLEWETIYNIALGIARGLEYLHKGCNARILHFDIKPHNILLDEKFCPKISDFGLAKICRREQSSVSMLGARGTIGYIAPEVVCRSIGGISHKSNVYSYGMLVLEMIGGRRNIEVDVDHTSEIFFPDWIYKRIEQDEYLGLQNLTSEKDHESVRKMIIVGLWCIQTNPSSRPSMDRVVNMLEGLEPLQVPPKLVLSSPSRSPSRLPENSSTTMESLQ